MSRSPWYDKYLRSEHWDEIRFCALLVADDCCEFCGNHGVELNVHHLNYDNLWNEQPSDVIVLCASCHADVHEFPRREVQVAVYARRHVRDWAGALERLEGLP